MTPDFIRLGRARESVIEWNARRGRTELELERRNRFLSRFEERSAKITEVLDIDAEQVRDTLIPGIMGELLEDLYDTALSKGEAARDRLRTYYQSKFRTLFKMARQRGELPAIFDNKRNGKCKSNSYEMASN